MTPLERAASAVENLIGTHCETCENQLPSDPAEIVRAVLQAIRDPSEAMLQAAYEASEDYFIPDAITKKGLKIALAAMLDAAMADQDEFIAIPRLTD